MNKELLEHIKEIVTKEDERYLLTRFGLLNSKGVLEKEVYTRISSTENWKHATRSEIKKIVLDSLYTEHVLQKGLQSFISKQDINKADWIYYIYKEIIKRLRLQYNGKETIDKELIAHPRTIAFRLSLIIFCELFKPEDYKTEIIYPKEVERNLGNACAGYYPVDVNRLTELLKRENPDFWEEISVVIYKIAKIVFYKDFSYLNYKDDLRSENWSKTEKTLKEYIFSGKNPTFENGYHLYNYMKRISRNHALNALKKKNMETPLDDRYETEMPETEIYYSDSDYLGSVDIRNEYEVQDKLVDIIYNQRGNVYNDLVDGIEDRVEMLLQFSIDDLPYRDISESIYGDTASKTEADRQDGNIRQNVLRVKKILIKRFYKILENHKY